MEITRADAKQQEAIADLLKSTFSLSPPFLSTEFLRWKLFSPSPSSEGSRSYVISEGGNIMAHICEWPISFLSPSGPVTNGFFIDWAARQEARGTGRQLFQYVLQKYETALTIGGTEKALPIYPKLGFQHYGTLDEFALVTRPWQQHCGRPQPQRTELREIARLSRNSIWSLKALWISESNWASKQVSKAYDLPESAFRVKSSTFCLGIRSAAWLQYIADCPLMKCSLFTLFKGCNPRGYFLLNQISGQCRIIDLAVDSDVPQDWEGAYRSAVISALKQKEVSEIVAISSLPWLSEILRKIGFQHRKQNQVLIYDPAKKLLGGPPLHLRMTDNDACFLYEERYPFLT